MKHTLIESLAWRYATKVFDPSKKIPEDELHTLLEAMRLAPSSFGLEPWKFIVVTNPELRATLRTHSWNQAQVTDASHLVVIAIQNTITKEDIETFISRIADARSIPVESLAGYKTMITQSVTSRTPEQIAAWNAKQAYIALGFLLETAASLGIDACPMEGFDSKAYDSLLGLDANGYSSVVICPIGYRGDDAYANATKVRKTKEEVVQVVL